MNKENLLYDEAKLANMLRNEILTNSQTLVEQNTKPADLANIEMISTLEPQYVSPIFSMTEDEILNFVEEFQVNELATLSVAELNHIGKVLGVDPMILVEGED